MMGTWYGTLLISEYGITILILMVMVHFMVTLLYGGYTCFMIGFMFVYSSDYSFLNIAWAKLLSMIFILLTGYQFWVLWNDFKRGTLQKEWT